MEYIRPRVKKSCNDTPMKQIHYLFLAVCILLVSLYAEAQEWSEPINVAKGHAPAVAIDRKTGIIHIVSITNEKTGGVLYAALDSLGNIVTSPYMVQNTVGDSGTYTFGPAIDIDQYGNPNILFRQHPQEYQKYFYDVYYARLKDGIWQDYTRVSVNQRRGYMSRLAVDYNNRVHTATGYQREDYFWGGVNYNQVYDGDLVAGAFNEITTLERDEWRPDDRLAMAITPNNNIHLVLGCPGLFGNQEGPVTYYRSENGGESFKWIADIHTSDCYYRNGAPDVFADKAGNVHFCFGAMNDLAVNDKTSIRYVRYDSQGVQRINKPVTRPGDIEGWKWGISSVAASDDGQHVVIVYVKAPGQDLYAVVSHDAGNTWSDPVYLDNDCGGPWYGYDGRDLPMVRAYRNHFYVVYPQYDRYGYRGVRMITFRNVGDEHPVADAGGPYSSVEGEEITFDASASADQGQNSGIVSYQWDMDGDGTFDALTAQPVFTTAFSDDYSGTITLRVTDRIGQTSDAEASAFIENVAPVLEIGGDITCDEGDTLRFSAQVTDPGVNDTFEYTWDLGDGSTAYTAAVTHVYGDNGVYEVAGSVQDDDGGADSDNLTVTVRNVTPEADPGGPYTGSLGREITFEANAYDPGADENLHYNWDLDGDGTFESVGEVVAYTYMQTGVYTISLEVTDKDDASDTTSTTVTVSNEPPQVSEIPQQTIYEKQEFQPIQLDLYVSDPDHNPDELTWEFRSSGEMNFSITDRMLYAAPPDSEWSGTDTLFLKVKDPGNLSDSTTALFTVLPVNDPPMWKTGIYTTMAEDDTLVLSFSLLQTFVDDIDSDPETFRFWASEGVNVNWDTAGAPAILFWGSTDWWGEETLKLYVADNHQALDSTAIYFDVTAKPDPPLPFNLAEPLYATYTEQPDSIKFVWHTTTDPDSGSSVYYEWRLRKQGTSSTSSLYTKIVQDTVYVFHESSQLQHGIYIWQVTARDETGKWRNSDDIGIIDLDIESSVKDSVTAVPEKYMLLQNYPNPFNGETKISFYLPEQGNARLVIYNQIGQVVCTLAEGLHADGLHTKIWNGRDVHGQNVPTGVYFYRLEAGGQVRLRKMVYIR